VTSSRRFPPPWTAEETDACFIVKDHAGHSLAYVYFEDESGRRAAEKLLTRDEARHNVRPADQSGYLRGRARKSAGEADARTTPNSGLSLSEAVRHSTSPYSNV
jgi:hypothetical protein